MGMFCHKCVEAQQMGAFILTSTTPHVAQAAGTCSWLSLLLVDLPCNVILRCYTGPNSVIRHCYWCLFSIVSVRNIKTRTHAHTHTHTATRGADGAHRCGNTWFLQAALRAHDFLSRLDSFTFWVSPVAAAGTTRVLSWTRIHPRPSISPKTR